MKLNKAAAIASACSMAAGSLISAAAAAPAAVYTMDSKTETGITYTGSSDVVLGQKGSAVSFNGGYAELGSYPLGDSFTFSAWIKPAQLGMWERIFDFGTDTNNYIFLTSNCADGKPRLAIKVNKGTEENITSSQAIRADEWTHLAVTNDNGAFRLYVNGVLTASKTLSSKPSALSGSRLCYIGKSMYASDPTYYGAVDEIEIYQNALTDAEVKERMDATAAKIASVEELSLDREIYLGETPVLPKTVTVTYENGMTAAAAIEWDEPAAYDEVREYRVSGKYSISGTENTMTAVINVKNTSNDPDYAVVRSINYVKNSGAAYADVIFDITTDKTDALTASAAVFKDGMPTGDAASAEVSGGKAALRIPLNTEGRIEVRASLYKNSSPETPISEISRVIDNKPSFAASERFTLERGSTFETSEQTGLDYILGVDAARLLQPSYEMHGITLRYEDGVDVGQADGTKAGTAVMRYGGWEMKGTNTWGGAKNADSFTLAGEQMGHWLSAAAVFYRDMKESGTSADEVSKLEYRMNYLIDKLDELQNSDINASTVTSREYIGGCPETAFTKCFAGDRNWAKDYWVPWYGIHKIYQGLLDVYDYAPDNTALKAYTVLKKFSDWAVDGSAKLSDAQLQTVLDVEYGGMNEIFARMYEITGEEKYLYAARRFTHDVILNPLIANTDALGGKHANTQIPKIVGAAEIYEQAPDTYADYRRACENFWHYVNEDRCYAIGGNSISEHFEASNETETLGVKTCESCNTYNMMRLTEHLFSWEQNSYYMDWYEKALYNHILGQQEPETGAKMYFVSLLQGHHRIYEKKYESWWCCTGTGMENPGRYTRAAFYEDGASVYMNLYLPGEYHSNNGLGLKIETAYPYSDKIKLTVTEGAAAELKLRAPAWLKSAMTAAVNGEAAASSNGGEYMSISREWKAGDVIELTVPMEIRTYKPRTANQTVYEYGPIVLAAELGECPANQLYTAVETVLDSTVVDTPYIDTNGEDSPSEETLAGYVEAVDTSKLQFAIKAQYSSTGRAIALKPFTEISHSYHNVYWNLNSAGDIYERKLNKVTIDEVTPDGQQDEMGHGMNQTSNDYKVNSHQGSFVGADGKSYQYRDAYGSADAFFRYDMGVDGAKQNYLFVRYWGGDVPFSKDGKSYRRDFRILVDGQEIASQTINNPAPGKPYDVFYEIPQTLTAGKEKVLVTFAVADASSCAGGVLGVRTTSTNDLDSVENSIRDSIKVTSDETTISYTSDYDPEASEIDLFAALYDKENRLIDVKRNEAAASFAKGSDAPYKVRFFFWDKNGIPAYEVLVTD